MRKGFTLAEVLITLAITGVVAALTIPTVVRNYQERETVSALKKFYSQISQAFKLAEVENGPIDTWNWGQEGYASSADNILKIISPYLKISQNCGTGQGCFASKYVTLSGTPWDSGDTIDNYGGYTRARLVDGMSFWLYSISADCTENRSKSNETKHLTAICGQVGVDLNGNKKPNVWGRDTFYFYVTKYGVIPRGTKDDRIYGDLSRFCSTKSTNGASGYNCAAWILAKDNMDYLHRDVSW